LATDIGGKMSNQTKQLFRFGFLGGSELACESKTRSELMMLISDSLLGQLGITVFEFARSN
jgi:hypothetical protein